MYSENCRGGGHSNGGACGNGGSGAVTQRGGEFGLSCGPEGAACGAAAPLWYASANGLLMGRDNANGFWTTYQTNNNPNQLMKTTQADVDWGAGYEVKFGRRFCCGLWAVEGVYWGLPDMDGAARCSVPGGSVSTPLMIGDVEFAGVNATQIFDGAQEHRLWRDNEFHNLEINLVRARLAEQWCTPLDISALVGVRYFRFEENLTFASLDLGGTWGGRGGLDQAYLHDGIENNLLGVQVGVDAGYRLGCNWRLFVAPKLGIYNNHIKNRFDLYRGDGVYATPTAASGMVGAYPVSSSADQFAFLGQLDLGLDWRFAPCWTAFAGYRLIGVTNVGLADNQVPTYVVDIPEIAKIDTNGSLILHGAFAGVKFEF
jgi:hypothetical protein